MRKVTTTAGIIFWAVSSVYPVSALSAAPAVPATTPSTAKSAVEAEATGGQARTTLLDETAGPITANTPVPATQPAPGTSVDNSQVSVSDVGLVEIHVNEASLPEVLRMLSLQSNKNIIAGRDVKGTVTANLYNVTVKEALDAILRSNGYAYRERGNFIYVHTAKEIADMEKADLKPVTEVFRLQYTTAAVAATMIKPILSGDAQVAFTADPKRGIEQGGTKDNYDNPHALTDVMVVTDYPDRMERVRKVLREIDRRPAQILVEATIVSAALNEDNALGVDFAVLGGVDFSSITSAGSTFGDAASGAIINKNTDGARNIVENGYSVGQTGFTSKVGGGGLRVGVVSNNIAIFLQALEGITDTVVLANPKVLALNKQKGEVLVGSEDGYITTTVTDNATVQTVEFLKTGTRLIFRPFVGDDGYVRMEVHPEDSNGTVINGLPRKTTTEVTTNVMVRDGHTVVIGGLFREFTQAQRSQVPGVGNLPLLGPLFRSQSDSTKREEIIILLTPHIIKDDARYSEASEKVLKDAEKMRVGMRHGLQWWGRERLAESCYEKANEEVNRNNRKTALFWLDCATNLNPKFLEAIDLKARLNGREVTSVDNSSIRYFLKRQVLAERAAATTMPVDLPSAEPRPSPAPTPVAATPVADNGTVEESCENCPGEQELPGEQEQAVDQAAVKPADEYALAEKPSTQPSTRPVADSAAEDEDAEASLEDAMEEIDTGEPAAAPDANP